MPGKVWPAPADSPGLPGESDATSNLAPPDTYPDSASDETRHVVWAAFGPGSVDDITSQGATEAVGPTDGHLLESAGHESQRSATPGHPVGAQNVTSIMRATTQDSQAGASPGAGAAEANKIDVRMMLVQLDYVCMQNLHTLRHTHEFFHVP